MQGRNRLLSRCCAERQQFWHVHPRVIPRPKVPASGTCGCLSTAGTMSSERGYTGALLMPELYSSFQLRLDNVLVATDFSPASKQAVLYATAIARRHSSKLFVAHVVSSRSESARMDGWRAGQAEMTELLIANRLHGIQNELIVKSGDIWPVLSQLIAEKGIDLIIVGTRGRTGLRKYILGSVAENIFRQAPGPVLTVGPNTASQNPEIGPERILAATGFAPHSLFAVSYAIRLAQDLGSSLALLHVVTDGKNGSGDEPLAKLRGLIPVDVHLPAEPLFFVEFGSAPEKILQTAAACNANLIVLGLRRVQEASRGETTWGRAYEVISKATCPVLTVRGPE
jgi:nucleotide-binding universal stress UspA family protein